MSDPREDMMSNEVELRRIDHTATIWFAATVIAVAIPLAALLHGGWRPSDLHPAAGVAFWIGVIVVGVGLAGIGYAGCPIYWGNVRVAHLQKSIAIRGGLVCFLLGSFVVLVAVLTG
jgi:hypothetical protein